MGATLTTEEKIAIGVCAAVGGLILIGILIFICIVFRRNRRENRVIRKERIYYDDRDRNIYHEDRHYYHDRPYTISDDYKTKVIEDYKPPPHLYYGQAPALPPAVPPYRPIALPPALPPPPPPPPPPAPLREVREVVYRRPERIEPTLIQYGGYNARTLPPRGAVEKYYRGDFRADRYTNRPIVIPLSEPDYIYTGSRYTRPDTHYIRYHDDQALLGRGSIRRNYGELRRTASLGELGYSRRPYVGEWVAKSDNLEDFNKEAYDKGRDPFLWNNSSRDYDYVRRF